MLRLIPLTLTLITFGSVFVYAEDKKESPFILSGKMLLECAQRNANFGEHWQDYYCSGFLHGLIGGIRSEREEQSDICLPPKGPTNNEMYNQLKLHIDDHPELKNENSRKVAYEILRIMYPCQSF